MRKEMKQEIMQYQAERDERRVYLELMINLAKSSGFFSVWMEVFKDDDEIKNMLISIYPGTRTEYVSN